MADMIVCPNCHSEIELNEALSAKLQEELRAKFDDESRRREEAFANRERELSDRETAVAASLDAVEEEIKTRLATEREQLRQDASKKAHAEAALAVKDLQEQLAAAQEKATASQKAELEIRRAKRELETQKEELELTVARTMDAERQKIREQAKREAVEERALNEAAKDKLINDLRQQIENLKQRSEQGSQQLQGEILELELEAILTRAFPFDTIEPVPQGVHGGDVIQRVRDSSGCDCGKILWESKRTKTWSDGWLPKLRDDQRAAKAHAAVLVSIELPRSLTTFACIDTVWVSGWPCVIGIASALRAGLIEVAAAKRAVDGQHGKMELLYNYLSGPEFRQRVEAIVEAFVTLKNDLDTEKRSIQRMWAKREKQLERAVASTVGLHGDLGGIIGAALAPIERLDVPAIATSENGIERQQD